MFSFSQFGLPVFIFCTLTTLSVFTKIKNYFQLQYVMDGWMDGILLGAGTNDYNVGVIRKSPCVLPRQASVLSGIFSTSENI